MLSVCPPCSGRIPGVKPSSKGGKGRNWSFPLTIPKLGATHLKTLTIQITQSSDSHGQSASVQVQLLLNGCHLESFGALVQGADS